MRSSRASLLATSVFVCNLLFATPARSAVLIHTNDILGELEPCGCRSNPKGGLARHYTLIKRTENTAGAGAVLQLDGGDLFFASATTAPMLVKQAKVQAEFIAKALDLTGLDAAVPGEKDFSLGLSVFENLLDGHKFKFLAANLVRKNSKNFLEPYAFFSKKSEKTAPLRIAVLGLVGEELSWPKELQVLPAIKTAEKWVPELRKKADFIIVLSHLGFEKDQELAKKVKGIDLIVGSHSQSFLQEPVKLSGASLIQASFKNQYVGVLSLTAPLSENDLGNYKLIGLDSGFDSEPGKPNPIDSLVVDFKKAIAELSTKQDAELGITTTATPQITFQTFPRCVDCHRKQADFWRKTPHFKALKSLVDKKQARNKDCLLCHSLGLGELNGFSDVNKIGALKPDPETPLTSPSSAPSLSLSPEQLSEALDKGAFKTLENAWAPVQCENCHGPSGNHPFGANAYSKKVEKAKCLSCHTPDRATEWYDKTSLQEKVFTEKLKRMTCPPGDPTEEP